MFRKFCNPIKKKFLILVIFSSTVFFLNKYYSKTITYNEQSEIRKKDLQYNNTDNCVRHNKEFSVLIDGVKYPKIIPQYYNKSIDFACLQLLNSAPKKILFWTNFHGDPLQDSLRRKLTENTSSDVLKELKCPVTNCELTFDRKNYNESSLVLFHMRNQIDVYKLKRQCL